MLVRNPPHERKDDLPKGAIGPLLKLRNVRFSIVLATLNMASYASLLGFGPLYFVNVSDMSNATMGGVMTGIGLIGVLCAFVGPVLSDRFGRKPVIFTAYAISAAGALLLAVAGTSLPLVLSGAMLIAVGGAGTGALIMAIIPAEAAPDHLKGTAMGFNAGVGELIGAGLLPILIGWATDQVGLTILPWILAAVGVLFCLLTLGLRESAPLVVARRSVG